MARRTQAVIMQAFVDLLEQKPLDKITVKDIIEEADINRNTFYYYYENIPALLDALFAREIASFSESEEKSDSFQKEYLRASALIRDHKRAIYHIYQSESREMISRYLETAAELFVERFVRDAAQNRGLGEKGIYYVTHFYSYAIVGMTIHAIRENMLTLDERLPERIESTFYASLDDVIRDYIRLSEKRGETTL